MQPLEYPELDTNIPGVCGSDGSVTHTQLPCGSYLCPACVGMYREFGWLDVDFELTENFFAEHPHLWWLRIYRKERDRCVIDSEALAVELRTLLTSGESVEHILYRLQCEARVGHFHLVRAVALVLGLELREARRLVVQAVGNRCSTGSPNQGQ